MPFLLKSTEEARAHLNEASRKVMDRVKAIKGALPKGPESEPISKLATLVGEGLDDIHSQQHTTWNAVAAAEERANEAFAKADSAQAKATTNSGDLRTLETGVGVVETMAMEARGDATVALRMSGTNLSLHQERQLSDSQLCVVMKGVRPINKEGRERYKDMMVAFENAMVEIRLGKQIQPKFLQRISKRKDDKSARPPHMRVELQSIGHKVQIYEQVRQFRIHNNRAPSFSVAPDIPKYALNRHNTLQKIAQICRDSHNELMTRVCIKNKKWPEIQIRNPAGEWSTMPDTIFEPARAEYNRRSKEEADKRKAKKAAKGARPKTVPMDTTSSS